MKGEEGGGGVVVKIVRVVVAVLDNFDGDFGVWVDPIARFGIFPIGPGPSARVPGSKIPGQGPRGSGSVGLDPRSWVPMGPGAQAQIPRSRWALVPI